MNVLWGRLTHGERQNILQGVEKVPVLVHAVGLLPKYFKSMKGIDLSVLFQLSVAFASLVPAIAAVKPCCQMNLNIFLHLLFCKLMIQPDG